MAIDLITAHAAQITTHCATIQSFILGASSGLYGASLLPSISMLCGRISDDAEMILAARPDD